MLGTRGSVRPPSGPRSRLHCPQGAPRTSPPAGAVSAFWAQCPHPAALPPSPKARRLEAELASQRGLAARPPRAWRSALARHSICREDGVGGAFAHFPLPQGSLLEGRAAPFTSASQRLAPPGHNTLRRCENDITPCRLLLLESWGETKLRSLVFVGFQSRLCPTASSRPSCPLPPGPGPHPHPGPVDHTVL